MRNKKYDLFPFIVGFVVLLIITVPYLYAFTAGGDQAHFGGFLFNPLDGNTYLAKMRQGWDGSWRFRLPYTADPGEGAYLNLFYLTLGHVSRILHLPLLMSFHLARWISSVALLWMLWHFFGKIFQKTYPRRIAFVASTLGSGMGWLLLPISQFTADFWVAETYPFLSAYTNPHFSLGLVFMLWIITPNDERHNWQTYLKFGGVSMLLSVIAPFGVVISLTIIGSQWLCQTIRNWRGHRNYSFPHRAIAVLVGGFPFLIYDFWIVRSDPVFSVWDLQNLTPSPAWWDVLISLSPALPIVIFTLWKTRRKASAPDVLLLWLVIGLTLVYLPWNLQRRFMMGLYIPVSGLVAWSLSQWASSVAKNYKFRVLGLFLLILPTNIIIIMTSIFGILMLDEKIYLSQNELHAIRWLDEQTDPEALILAGPDMGLWIPVYSGQRVIYGHPFETAFAEKEKETVQLFFSGKLNVEEMQALIDARGVDYIFVGPRELLLGEIDLSSIFSPVFSNEGVTIYDTVSSVP
ncbi:MAG: hypothetical protein IMY76_02795 [Chloroflexi bacterium]|nr:hypothetical protein [Chloroflexota bacterium]